MTPESGTTPNAIRADRAFSETVDPAAYVPREATEAVLTWIQEWSRAESAGPSIAALIAAPGLGKTFLLRLVESRLERRSVPRGPHSRVLYLPYAGLRLTDLNEWVHGLLGRTMRRSKVPGDAHDAHDAHDADRDAEALVDLIGLAREADRPFYLLIDDADSMPPETVRVLLEGLPHEESPLRLLLALNPDAKSSRLLAALDGFGTLEIRLDDAMREEETAAYVRGRLRWAGLDAEGAESFDEAALRRIHSHSGGVPRRIHRLARSLLESAEVQRPSDLEDKLRREDWMGRPIEDEL